MATEHEQILIGWRVLAVEDDYYAAMDLRRWLTSVGARVLGPVPSLQRASECIEADGLPDLAVLDIHLGGADRVYPLAARLAALEVPFFFLTNEIDIHPDFRSHPCVAKYLGERGFRAMLQVLVDASPPKTHRIRDTWA